MPGASSAPHQRGRTWRGAHLSSPPLLSLHPAIIPPVRPGRYASLIILGGLYASLHTCQDFGKKSKHPQKEADSSYRSPSRLSWSWKVSSCQDKSSRSQSGHLICKCRLVARRAQSHVSSYAIAEERPVYSEDVCLPRITKQPLPSGLRIGLRVNI